MKTLVYPALLLISILCLTNCAGQDNWEPKQLPKPLALTLQNRNAEQFLQMAATAPSPQQQYYQLKAVEKLITDNKLTRAAQILATINTHDVPSEITTRKQLLFAKVQLADKKPNLALQALNEVPLTPSMSKSDQTELHESLAKAYAKTGNIVASIEQRNLLNPLLPDPDARKQNQLTIWNSVQHLPETDINNLLTQPLSPDIRGWLELAQMAQNPNLGTTSLADQIDEWKRSYPIHSGNDILPQKLSYTANTLSHNPKHVFLLLPLHGKFAKNGLAVRNGFMAAYYSTKQDKKNRMSITILDTSQADITSLYQKAVKDGADFVIGPLIKSNSRKLTENVTLSVPTLMLSYIPGLERPNLFQFGLSQIDEAEQIAEKARKDGYSRSIVIAPKNSWGQSIAQHFQKVWTAQGGEVVDALAYQETNDLSSPIRNLLKVDQSDQRAKSLETLLHTPVRYVPNRRNDVDMIFLVALPQAALSIRPMLKFYYAGDVPVFATSLIYQPSSKSRKNHDLDHIQLAEMPWMLGGLSEHLQTVQQQAIKMWKKSYHKNPKFYALGVDAHELARNLKQLAVFPHFGVQGATGTLYLREGGHIFRKLRWAEMASGRPHTIDLS